MALLDEVKSRLGITGDYHDATLEAYASDVKEYLVSAGVPFSIVESEAAYGCIARGVADLWNYGSGDGRLSPVFYERVIQMAYQEAERCPR